LQERKDLPTQAGIRPGMENIQSVVERRRKMKKQTIDAFILELEEELEDFKEDLKEWPENIIAEQSIDIYQDIIKRLKELNIK
jgi:hypothetical protein